MGQKIMFGEGVENTAIIDIVFWVISVSTIVAAIAVVQLKDLFRAALFLIVAFIGVAGMFIMLRSEFLAIIQILIYVGAISVLLIFAIFMTRDVESGSPANNLPIPAGILAVGFGVIAVVVILSTNWLTLSDGIYGDGMNSAYNATPTMISGVFTNTVPWIGRMLLQDFVLAFEVASVLLLSAVIGALALIRERD